MSEQKPKKPFLKRGTRQFLSNATVRSLSQKPRIVQFQDGDSQTHSSPFAGSNFKNEAKQQIFIAVKPKNASKQKPQSASTHAKQNFKKTNNLPDRVKQSRNQTNAQENIQVITKPTSSSNSLSKGGQKKPTLLTDYLNNDSNSSKKPVKQSFVPTQVPKSATVKTVQPSFVQSQAQNLRMQDIEDDSDQDNFKTKNNYDEDDDNEFIAKNKKLQHSPEQVKRVEPIKKKPNLLQQAFGGKKQKQNMNMQNQKIDEKPQQNEVNFQSDSDEDQKQNKNHFKSKTNKIVHNNRFNQNADQDEVQRESDDEQEINRKATVKMGTKPQSKVTQMFNKNANQKIISQQFTQPQPTKQQKMTIDDVPKQLMEQIVQKYFKQAKVKYEKKQQNLFDQVKVVQKKQQSLNDQQKNLQKRIKQFQKQMQEKNKQFENKIKSEQNKISRQKMYLKDQQTTGKPDWKTKNQIQQLKQLLEEQRNQKKRIQVKLRGELDRLKARYNEDMQVKKNLQNRIKDYELKEIKERELKTKEQRQVKQEIIQKKKSFWDDAPKQTYLQRLYAKDFSLNEFTMEDYFYEHNEFYQYYKLKGESDTLKMQQNQGNKIKRTYQNGKIQIESSKKFVKEIFPWGFIIVHYINGDVKQIIQINRGNSENPKQMEIYYAKNSQIIEYSIADGKHIHYFLAEDQIELKDQLISLREVYTGNQLQRITQGNSLLLQRNARGMFVEMY